jgi:hypothetical protein
MSEKIGFTTRRRNEEDGSQENRTKRQHITTLHFLSVFTCRSPSPADSPHDRMMDADMAKPLAMLEVRFTTTAVRSPPSACYKSKHD